MSTNRPAVITNPTAHAVAERPTAAAVAARSRNDGRSAPTLIGTVQQREV